MANIVICETLFKIEVNLEEFFLKISLYNPTIIKWRKFSILGRAEGRSRAKSY